jgi:hypothetical protein
MHSAANAAPAVRPTVARMAICSMCRLAATSSAWVHDTTVLTPSTATNLSGHSVTWCGLQLASDMGLDNLVLLAKWTVVYQGTAGSTVY